MRAAFAAACFPPRERLPFFARLHAGRPYRTSKTRNLIKNNHRCTPPWDLRTVQCTVRGTKAKVVTYEKLCSSYVKLYEPFSAKDVAPGKAKKQMSAKLSNTLVAYTARLNGAGGTLLHHSITDKVDREMWCQASKGVYELSRDERGQVCAFFFAGKCAR